MLPIVYFISLLLLDASWPFYVVFALILVLF